MVLLCPDAFIKYDEAGVDRLEIGGSSGARFSNTTSNK